MSDPDKNTTDQVSGTRAHGVVLEVSCSSSTLSTFEAHLLLQSICRFARAHTHHNTLNAFRQLLEKDLGDTRIVRAINLIQDQNLQVRQIAGQQGDQGLGTHVLSDCEFLQAWISLDQGNHGVFRCVTNAP